MLFNSVNFLIFFPIAAFVYFIIPHKVRYIWLLICSYYFYMCWNAKYALLILTSTVVTYLSGILIGKIRNSEVSKKEIKMKWTVAGSFIINLGILAYFKYFNFFIDNINAVLAHINTQVVLPQVDVLLPVGISFYTFQALSYTADVYNGKIEPEKNFFMYALFVSFFPQLVAGPIERSTSLLGQLKEKHYFDFDRARDGLLLMLWGYFLKVVVADRIAQFCDVVFGDTSTYGGTYIVVAALLFAFQIYCDFAGYSTIALGAAQIMGFKLTDNFNAPYYSQSTKEFWNRWHVSLNGWFRDYVYIPLGGNRKGKVRKYINLMIVFLVSGLWHGAAWGYVIWGGLNGLYQIIGELLMPIRNKLNKWLNLDRDSVSHKIYRTLGTFLLVDFTWIFFRCKSAGMAISCIKSMLTVKNPWVLFDNSFYEIMDEKNFHLMLISILIIIVADFFKFKNIKIRDFIQKQEYWFRWLVFVLAIVGILTVGVWGSGYNATSFIYFQF